ncbi:flavin-containing monooxygenase [Kribbella sp. NPDC059898]|uniref:flavin-containing monooxygenase n=1 Tax=Kribbella sp. NPDC059898 TaxID=3346995 RepID=UPI00365D5676
MDRFGTVVIGGGQAGLVMGYYLRRLSESFVILEADARIGDSWRRRYDALRLFSRPRYASLPGLRIPVKDCPTRDEMADYLERYAAHFELPVQTGVQVTRVSRDAQGFLVDTDSGEYFADRVVVASGWHVVPQRPAFAAELDPAIRQLHSLEYRNPEQFADGEVLVVGAANSGTDIALEAVKTHPTRLAGRHPGQVPVDIDTRVGHLTTPLVMFAFKHVLTRRTPMGRKVMASMRGHGVNLVRNKIEQVEAAGVVRHGRIESVRDGYPVTADGEVLSDVRTVVWCTGSGPDHSWLDLPDGPHTRGISDDDPRLMYLGAEFQFAVASATIQGLDRDARYLIRHLRDRRNAAVPAGVTRP